METCSVKYRHLVIDFETFDPHLKRHGIGAAFKINFPTYEFEVLGAAYITQSGKKGYTSNWEELQGLLDSHDSLIMHNGLYDTLCLECLVSEGKLKFDIKCYFIWDTLILAKLYNQNFFSYSLDNLATLLLKVSKKSDLLHDFAWGVGLYQDKQKQATGRNVHTRPSDAVMDNFCKSNMNLFPEEIVGEYAIGDVVATKELFNYLLPKIPDSVDLELYSDLQKIVLTSKIRGVRIDLKKAREVRYEFYMAALYAEHAIYSLAGKRFNLNSPAQLAPILIDKGYILPKTDKGNFSVNKEWLETAQGEFTDCLKKYRQATKMKRDFVDKLINYQEAIPKKYRDDDDIGIIFPTMKILGATTTGRFSSGGGTGCLEVNIQQIPSRNKEFGEPCRSLFIAHDGESWGYSDFSSQESRLQVHYAKLLNCDGVDEVVDGWNTDPNMSFHSKVAEVANIGRDQAKTINLGLSYGMGALKLYSSLGVSERQGQSLLKQYHQLLPFMQQLQKKAAKGLKTNKYIKTIGGRKLVIGKGRGAERDGLSKLIQGSAADQAKRAMQRCWKKGISILFIVHDEVNISTCNPEKDVLLLKECMEGAYKLVVPVLSEVGHGDSWLAAKNNSGE